MTTAFSDTLRKTILERHHSQRLVAEYLTDWRGRYNIDAELDRLRKGVHRSDRDRFDATAEAIRSFCRRKPKTAAKTDISQAAVCKWYGGETNPIEVWWLPLASYLMIPVWEVHAMIDRDAPPETAPRLRQELDSARGEIRELKGDREQLRLALQRAENRLSVVEVEMAKVLARLRAYEEREVLAATEVDVGV